MRRTLLLPAGTLVLAAGWLAPTASAHVARPDPVLASVHLDYVDPLPAAAGEAPGYLVPLSTTVSAQAVSDERYLRYRTRGDLGGFLQAPLGGSPLVAHAREIVGGERHSSSQIPQYGEAAEGVVRSFAFIGGVSAEAPDNGRRQVRGVGAPPQLPLPANSNAVPPPNEGFGGRTPAEGTNHRAGKGTGGQGASGNQGAAGGGGGGKEGGHGSKTHGSGGKPGGGSAGKSGGKHKHPPGGKHSPPPPVETPPPSGGGGGSDGGGGGAPTGASCGTAGLSVRSDHSTCRIYAVNMEPGGSASEVMTVRDEAGVPVVLSLRASGEENRFWNDLCMGVWQVGAAAPDPLPALLWWTTQDNTLTSLSPGQQVSYEIELYLPLSAGNEDQGQGAVVDLTWHAQQ